MRGSRARYGYFPDVGSDSLLRGLAGMLTIQTRAFARPLYETFVREGVYDQQPARAEL